MGFWICFKGQRSEVDRSHRRCLADSYMRCYKLMMLMQSISPGANLGNPVEGQKVFNSLIGFSVFAPTFVSGTFAFAIRLEDLTITAPFVFCVLDELRNIGGL